MNTALLLIGGYLLLTIAKAAPAGGGGGGGGGGSTATLANMISYWTDYDGVMDLSAARLVYRPDNVPPATGFRPASANEITLFWDRIEWAF